MTLISNKSKILLSSNWRGDKQRNKVKIACINADLKLNSETFPQQYTLAFL